MSEDLAKARFMAIQALRWSGVAFVVVGLLIIYGRMRVPPPVGYVLFVIGLIDALVLPSVLARRWRSPPP
jgi:hypothetical protein